MGGGRSFVQLSSSSVVAKARVWSHVANGVMSSPQCRHLAELLLSGGSGVKMLALLVRPWWLVQRVSGSGDACLNMLEGVHGTADLVSILCFLCWLGAGEGVVELRDLVAFATRWSRDVLVRACRLESTVSSGGAPKRRHKSAIVIYGLRFPDIYYALLFP